MKTKEDIVQNWLPRYTGRELNDFDKYILITNFDGYVNLFAKWHNVEVKGLDRPMRSARAGGITIINFGMGSPNAATMMDLLSAIEPEAVLFLGKCGGLKKKNNIGDLILPIAAVRGEGTSNDYFIRIAESDLNHHSRLCAGLLDRYRLHHQPPCMGMG